MATISFFCYIVSAINILTQGKEVFSYNITFLTNRDKDKQQQQQTEMIISYELLRSFSHQLFSHNIDISVLRNKRGSRISVNRISKLSRS